jgi:hypothetical protein
MTAAPAPAAVVAAAEPVAPAAVTTAPATVTEAAVAEAAVAASEATMAAMAATEAVATAVTAPLGRGDLQRADSRNGRRRCGVRRWSGTQEHCACHRARADRAGGEAAG